MKRWISNWVILGVLLLANWNCQAAETIEQIKEKAIEARPRINPPYPQPVLITSFGQGGGACITNALLSVQPPFESAFFPQATTQEVVQFKTLVIEVGVSLPALKKIGKNLGTEHQRADVLLKEAKTRAIPMVLLHLGGKDQRGMLPEDFLEKTIPYADYLIVMKEGNEDGYFTQKLEELGTPLVQIDRFGDLVQELSKLIKSK